MLSGSIETMERITMPMKTGLEFLDVAIKRGKMPVGTFLSLFVLGLTLFTTARSMAQGFGLIPAGVDGNSCPAELDFSFNPNQGANDDVFTLIVQSDGKILIGGQFTSFDGTDASRG